jgi:hypothetical protein
LVGLVRCSLLALIYLFNQCATTRDCWRQAQEGFRDQLIAGIRSVGEVAKAVIPGADLVACVFGNCSASDVAIAAVAVLPTGKGSVTLYRSVSALELSTLGKGFSLGGGAEGKYFAESLNDALKWSSALGNPHIVEVTVSKSIADQMYRFNKLDNIGPARFATMDQLNGAAIKVIK